MILYILSTETAPFDVHLLYLLTLLLKELKKIFCLQSLFQHQFEVKMVFF